MPQIEEELVLDIPIDKISVVHPGGQGKTISFGQLDLTPEEAATLAWLVHGCCETVLRVEIKVKPT